MCVAHPAFFRKNDYKKIEIKKQKPITRFLLYFLDALKRWPDSRRDW